MKKNISLKKLNFASKQQVSEFPRNPDSFVYFFKIKIDFYKSSLNNLDAKFFFLKFYLFFDFNLFTDREDLSDDAEIIVVPLQKSHNTRSVDFDNFQGVIDTDGFDDDIFVQPPASFFGNYNPFVWNFPRFSLDGK